MTRSRILRLPCGEAESGNFVLEAKSNGSKPLDLLIRGTDGASAFETKTRHNRIKEFKAANAPCSEAEWEQILIAILVDPQDATRSARDVEIKVELRSDEEVTLHFRKNIQGIAQRLGAIKLKDFEESDDNPGISPFDWCVAILEDHEKVVKEAGAAKDKVKELEQSVEELKSQFEDLLKAKDGDESVLLEKFRDLLNEKKLKIRQQQKLIESADVDPEKLQNIGASQRTMRKAGGSRTSKRKIKDEPVSEESDHGFEAMDVNGQSNEPQPDPDSDEQQMTDNNATGSEPDNDGTDAEEEAAPPKPAPNSKPTRNTRSRATKGSSAPPPAKATKASNAIASRPTRAAQTEEPAPAAEAEAGDDIAPPPVRTLPFKSRAKKPAPTPVPAADDETDSDDEL
ncbi:DNA double-strand break repair and VJ recombination XRCC4 [Apiospora saccharicola]|uniref:DNA double-strand break repair and VJ recombination XRCC4 n=1 Tax=Apiospora saccharicola TaxID=335842 RepID=A0ABR1W620_9PEZI